MNITIPMQNVYCVLNNSPGGFVQLIARCKKVEDQINIALNDQKRQINDNHNCWTFRDMKTTNISIHGCSWTVEGRNLMLRSNYDERRIRIQYRRKSCISNLQYIWSFLKLLVESTCKWFTIDKEPLAKENSLVAERMTPLIRYSPYWMRQSSRLKNARISRRRKRRARRQIKRTPHPTSIINKARWHLKNWPRKL